jgi:hypothetical protein
LSPQLVIEIAGLTDEELQKRYQEAIGAVATIAALPPPVASNKQSNS